MSKSTQRLIIRLSIVLAVVALGTFALISARNHLMQTPSDEEGQPGAVPAESPKEAVAAAEPRSSVDRTASRAYEPHPDGLSQFAPEQFQIPSAKPPVVRANDDRQFIPTGLGSVRASIGDAAGSATPGAAASPPPAQSPFDNRPGATAGHESLAENPLRTATPPDTSYTAKADYTTPAAAAPATAPTLAPQYLNPSPGHADQGSARQSTPDGTGSPPGAAAGGSYENPDDQPPTAPDPFPPSAPSAPAAVSPPPPGFSPPADTTSPLSAAGQGTDASGRAALGLDRAAGQHAGPAGSTRAASAVPGPKELEGVRAPSLALEKRAPAEIQVGKPATFQIKVQNVGQVDANQVVVIDRIPQGTRYVDATPEPTHAPDGALMWNLGTLEPGNDAVISLQLIPLTEGEIGSVATVTFQTQASVRTICTKPSLQIEHSGPSQVLIGQKVTFDIKVTNSGTGVATGVMLEEDVPEQLSHPAGSELEYEIGTLRPGESRALKLTLQAVKAGALEHLLLVRGDGNLLAESRVPLEVIAPQLKVRMEGPTRRYLERQATYTISVSNPGTAPAHDVELVSFLPKGMQFVATNNQGQYDPQTHAVYWSLVELPANETGTVQLTALPVEMGQQKLRVESRADLGLSDAQEQTVSVEGLAAIFFSVADTADPIEVGSDTVYQVQIVNQGSKTATGIRVAASLPSQLRPIGGDGPTSYHINGQTIVFEPLARLAPKGQALFKIQVRGLQEGDHRVTVQVVSEEIRTPVSKEESTRVYADR